MSPHKDTFLFTQEIRPSSLRLGNSPQLPLATWYCLTGCLHGLPHLPQAAGVEPGAFSFLHLSQAQHTQPRAGLLVCVLSWPEITTEGEFKRPSTLLSCLLKCGISLYSCPRVSLIKLTCLGAISCPVEKGLRFVFCHPRNLFSIPKMSLF